MSRFALEGVRILDFTHAYAGPAATRALADMGAEVIKVEGTMASGHVDMFRGTLPMIADLDGLERWHRWTSVNRGKLDCTLNLEHPKGQEIARKLASISDAVVENRTRRVMRKFSLDYSTIKKVKPDIVYVSLASFGATGPYADFVGYASQFESQAGLSQQLGFPDKPGGESVAFGDAMAGYTAAYALLVGLYYRSKSGRGQYIDMSTVEAMSALIPMALMEFAMNQRIRPRMGNRDDFMAPHGCYQCKGEDNWVTIAVATEEEWRAFCDAIGNPDWTTKAVFSDPLSRRKNQDELDRLVEQWTLKHTDWEVTEMLQKAGVAATPSLSVEALTNDPHLKEQGYFVEVEHPELGKRPTDGVVWALSETPGCIQRPGPTLGQDNQYVYGELLGMSHEEIKQLAGEAVI